MIAVQVDPPRMQSSNCAGHLFCEVVDLLRDILPKMEKEKKNVLVVYLPL